MKRRNKEINIFSMSALDLFASALGAFILIAIVLFPYFPNIGSSPEHVAALRAQLQDTQQRLQACQADLAQTQTELQQTQKSLQRCTEELRKKFLLVVISWHSADDIDLHVVDPQGNEFYYDARSHPGSEGKLEEDNTRGPGNEIWLHPGATPGEYKIYYKFFAKRSDSVSVRGAVLVPTGRRGIPDRRLREAGQKVLIAVVTIDNDGNATLRLR